MSASISFLANVWLILPANKSAEEEEVRSLMVVSLIFEF